jgi:hypothetical protein
MHFVRLYTGTWIPFVPTCLWYANVAKINQRFLDTFQDIAHHDNKKQQPSQLVHSLGLAISELILWLRKIFISDYIWLQANCRIIQHFVQNVRIKKGFQQKKNVHFECNKECISKINFFPKRYSIGAHTQIDTVLYIISGQEGKQGSDPFRVTRGRCYDHNFRRFLPIVGENNWRFSQKPMLW